ncbi:MAG: hypothetical protein ACKV0T_01755 [Planctomycetales bacterium]
MSVAGALVWSGVGRRGWADQALRGDCWLEAPEEESEVEVEAADGEALQAVLDRHAGSGAALRLANPGPITCRVLEQTLEGEKSIHALLIPAGVRLNLNGATLNLDLRSNSYGVRLSNDSAIRKGTIRVVRSEGKGSQGCWHSGISIGAAYGDGGTPDKPGRFSTVSGWLVEDITIDQQQPASAIQLMSEACHGTLRRIRILDSPKALLGIGLDWGSVGPITSEDERLSDMRRLWEQGKIYSTHPHDVVIENVRVGKLTRNVDGNDAGVRCSACHAITIRDVTIAEAATAVAVFGGDLGYEFAREDLRDAAHTGYRIEDVRIGRALRYGLVLNGSADNIWRAAKNHGYRPVRDPVHPGLDRVQVRRVTLRGPGTPGPQGLYAVAVTDGSLEEVSIEQFDIGVHVEDWVRGLKFQNCRITGNRRNTQVEGATEPATGVTFDPPVTG